MYKSLVVAGSLCRLETVFVYCIGMRFNLISSLINNKFRAELSAVNDTTPRDVEGEITKTMWTVAFSFIMVGSILGNSLVLWAVLGRNIVPHLPSPPRKQTVFEVKINFVERRLFSLYLMKKINNRKKGTKTIN